MTMKSEWVVAIAFGCIGLVVGYFTMQQYNKPKPPGELRYKFLIECPDKSRVEYIAAQRISKRVLCAPDPQ